MRIREESRTNTAVHDPTNGETTEINERGPAVSGKEIELFRDKLLYLSRGADVVVFAGSLPRGVESDVYAQLVKEVRKSGVQTVVDADGDPMRLAVRAEPDVISPNVIEAEELVGHEFNDDEDRIIAVREMVALGAREAIMTLPDGCVASVHRRRRADAAPRVDRAARGGGAPWAPATPSWPGSWPPATPARPRRSACASAWPAARSRPSASGPG